MQKKLLTSFSQYNNIILKNIFHKPTQLTIAQIYSREITNSVVILISMKKTNYFSGTSSSVLSKTSKLFHNNFEFFHKYINYPQILNERWMC